MLRSRYRSIFTVFTGQMLGDVDADVEPEGEGGLRGGRLGLEGGAGARRGRLLRGLLQQRHRQLRLPGRLRHLQLRLVAGDLQLLVLDKEVY